jgi:hypothetical protein
VTSNYLRTGPANASSDSPVISADGRYVIYRSFATDLVPGDTYPPPKLFIFDRLTGLNALLSVSQTDQSPSPWISVPAISTGGAAAAFIGVAPSQAAGDMNRALVVFSAGLDSDSDGLPDWWTLEYFGHPTGEASDGSRPGDDADNTGMNNWQKYVTGINPTNPASIFGIQASSATSPIGSTTLTFPVMPALSYIVQYKTNLNDPQWQNLTNTVSLSGNDGTVLVTLDQPGRFYRVVGSY